MTSGYTPGSEELGPDGILAALEEAIREDPGLQKRPPKMSPATSPAEVTLKRYLEQEPAPILPLHL